MALVVKNLPANAEDAGDGVSTLGLGRSPGLGSGNQSSILAWKILWAEESCGLQSVRLQRVAHDRATEHSRQ